LLTLPAVANAQFIYTNNTDIWLFGTNAGTIVINGYAGDGGAVTVPSTISFEGVDLPVTSMEKGTFNISFLPMLN